ncbi:uncharacterized protein LOC126884845 isoform X6 [Diabrotica virgifera virgifera]|uniref:Uncharacterized protein LOC114338831 isoform X3 n=1 Tax=Diabrotica virgifera virgifera TaxID=50390 RepID=A0A6P7GJ61_DIAVI|nr:uncharacterized protein LOC126884845 isoform X6 [Diabrotica virgifera virgifera]
MKLFSTFSFILILYSPQPFSLAQRLLHSRAYHSDDDDDHVDYHYEDMDDKLLNHNASAEKGQYVGALCEFTCSPKLLHVYCNPVTGTCDCEKKYPVKLNNRYAGCSKPKQLGDQCYYKETCQFTDQHASCIQVHHNAVCQCENGYHTVSLQKPSKRVFCAEDVVVITSDFSTFAGVMSGIAILSGLICFVLHLFNQNLYGTRHNRHRFGNANLPPPILFSSDPGSLPLPILDRSSTSRASSQRTYASMPSRRSSSAPGFRSGATYSRAGSRRPSIASVHSATSIRSYSTRRYERERKEKEERELERRFSKLSSTNSTIRIAPTPSPHSTDDLLPTLEEDRPIPPLATKEDSTTSFPEEFPSTSKQYP